MTEQTLKAFEKLRFDPWFQSVGKNDLPDVVSVRSWLHAVAQCAGLKWENTQLEGMNKIGDKVQARDRNRYFGMWNTLAAEAKSIVEPLVVKHVDPVLAREKLPEVVRKRVICDLSGFFMECEYRDIAVPGLFTDLAKVYRSGHFPCGWEGEYPQGRLIIF